MFTNVVKGYRRCWVKFCTKHFFSVSSKIIFVGKKFSLNYCHVLAVNKVPSIKISSCNDCPGVLERFFKKIIHLNWTRELLTWYMRSVLKSDFQHHHYVFLFDNRKDVEIEIVYWFAHKWQKTIGSIKTFTVLTRTA